MVVQTKEINEDVPDIPLIKDDNEYETDGFSISGFTNLPDLNFTEYLQGNKNQAYTDCLNNMARTVSVKYAKKKYQNDPKELTKVVNSFLYDRNNLKTLPFPKLGNTIRIHAARWPISHWRERYYDETPGKTITLINEYHEKKALGQRTWIANR